MRSSEFVREAIRFEREVEEVATGLIRDRGTPPWDAMEQAKKIVAERRRRVSAGLYSRHTA